MASLVTLAELRDRIRFKTDERPGGPTNVYVTDNDIDQIINEKIRKMYDVLVLAFENYYENTYNFNLAVSTATYTVPNDFYQAKVLWLTWGTNSYERVGRFQIQETPWYYTYNTFGRDTQKGYRVYGTGTGTTYIEFAPVPTVVIPVTFKYVPAFAGLVNDGDTFDSINGWDDAVVYGATADILAQNNRDATFFYTQYRESMQAIREIADQRNSDSPKHVLDVCPDYDYGPYGIERLPRP